MRIALVSLDQKWEDKVGNKAQCRLISQEIVEICPDIDLIVYPEMTLTGFSVKNVSLAEPEKSSDTISFFSSLSSQLKVNHIFGVSIKNEQDECFNRSGCIDRVGKLIAQYDKMHTFSFAGENELYTRGHKPQEFVYGNAVIGLSTCFDLRFSQLYSYYRKNCNLAINIANWPGSRKEHWLSLLQSRAIENQFYMIGVNRIGVDGTGVNYAPTSVVFSPLGELLSPMLTKKEYAVYDIDLDNVKKIRSQFPFINDLRPELYSEFK